MADLLKRASRWKNSEEVRDYPAEAFKVIRDMAEDIERLEAVVKAASPFKTWADNHDVAPNWLPDGFPVGDYLVAGDFRKMRDALAGRDVALARATNFVASRTK